MSEDNKITFLPFQAINEFMNDDYRERVISATLGAMTTLTYESRRRIDTITNRIVHIPSFRNSSKAPLSIKIKYVGQSFTKSPELVASILAAWSEANPALKEKIFELLVSRNWILLPIDADRTKLPGFMITWPKGEEFDVLNQAFQKMYSDQNFSSDDISLMVVWLSSRLPYQFVENLFVNNENINKSENT